MEQNEDKNVKIETLYDHYKDSFTLQRDYLKQRDRLFLYVLIAIVGLFLIIIIPNESYRVAGEFTTSKFGITLNLTPHFIDTVLWFLLLIFVMRYFQNTITVERQYNYIQNLEKRISEIINEESFSREGKGYHNNYSLYSDFAWFLYTWIFPILLILVSSFKICLEISELDSFRLSFLLNAIFFIAILLLTIIYMISYHKKK